MVVDEWAVVVDGGGRWTSKCFLIVSMRKLFCFERSPPKPSAVVPDGAGASWNDALCHVMLRHMV